MGRIIQLAILACLASVGRAEGPVSDSGCAPLFVFDTAEAVAAWRTVNDNVMGGRSSGGSRFADGALFFSGSINTNGGGFSSIRAPLTRGQLAGKNTLSLRVKPDGRAYKVTLRTNLRYRGIAVSFQGDIEAPAAGEWTDSVVTFADLQPTVFGRPVSGASFEAADVESIGIIISDGVDGPFELSIASIHACAATARAG